MAFEVISVNCEEGLSCILTSNWNGFRVRDIIEHITYGRLYDWNTYSKIRFRVVGSRKKQRSNARSFNVNVSWLPFLVALLPCEEPFRSYRLFISNSVRNTFSITTKKTYNETRNLIITILFNFSWETRPFQGVCVREYKISWCFKFKFLVWVFLNMV